MVYEDWESYNIPDVMDDWAPNGVFSLQVVCGPFWDNASCVPPTEAGHEAVFPCMTMFAGSLYNTRGETNVALHTASEHCDSKNISQIFPERIKKCWETESCFIR